MVEYCDTPETERREQTGNTKHTSTLAASSLLDLTGLSGRKPHTPALNSGVSLTELGSDTRGSVRKATGCVSQLWRRRHGPCKKRPAQGILNPQPGTRASPESPAAV